MHYELQILPEARSFLLFPKAVRGIVRPEGIIRPIGAGKVRQIELALSREELLQKAWGYVIPGETRTVDVHIQRLRKKLGFSCIETVYRRGYKLRAQAVY